MSSRVGTGQYWCITSDREVIVTKSFTSAQRWVLVLTATAALMVALDQLVVVTALNRIRDDLHASLATLDWTINAYSLSFAALLITGAALGDRFGRRRMFLVGLVIFTLASAACALAPNVATLIIARTIQGAGSALVMPLAVALLTEAFPIERRGPVVGLFTAITGLAVVGGPVVGGAVAEGIAWQWIFWINVPIGALLIPLALTRFGESRGTRSSFDLTGLALISAAMLGLAWGLVRANDAGWTSAEVVGTLAAGAAVGALFVAWERRVAEPMLPLALFRIRPYATGNATILLCTTSLFGAVFLLAQYFQISLGYGPLAAGIRFMPWTGTLFIVAPIAGVLIDRIGSRALLTAGLVLQSVGMGWVAYNVSNGAAYSSSIAALVISGCGTSLALPATQNTVMNAVPARYLGKASGTYNSLRQMGGVLGVAIASAVFAANGSYASPKAFQDGVAPALAVAAVLALAGAVVGSFSRAPRRLLDQTTQPQAATPATVEFDAVA
jgi:EmrB/QacA subfamily drug resistance transporter